MIITMANGKGGVGKTLVSLILASALKKSGASVSLSDRDPQRSASGAAEAFELELGEGGDIVIVDTAPWLDHEPTQAGIRDADKVIVVTTPSPSDFARTVHSIKTIGDIRGGVDEVFVAFNRIQNNSFGRDRALLNDAFGCRVFDKCLRSRTAYEQSMLGGWKSLNRVAQNEATELALAILANVSSKKKSTK